jgi:REP element-mobilizing transposase RayT
MSYWQLFYHIVWSTKQRQPLITPQIEPLIYDFLRAKAISLGGVVFAINGMEEHVHVVASIPPRIAVAKFVGQLKGVSSAKINKMRGIEEPRFAWQAEYGVFSFDHKRLPNVVAYVNRQKEHHAAGNLIPVLERDEGKSVRLVHEEEIVYTVDDPLWWREMLALSDR